LQLPYRVPLRAGTEDRWPAQPASGRRSDAAVSAARGFK
jgi:hypothetical protein